MSSVPACPAGGHRAKPAIGRSRPIHSPASGLTQLYQELRGELLRFLVARTGNPVEAEDLLQELWLRTREAPPGPIANGRAYLYRAAQNLVLDRIREARRREARDKDWSDSQAETIAGDRVDPQPRALDAMIAREDNAALHAAIERLPEGAGRAFRLHKLEGLPHAEVAARLGISRSGVEKHIAVAMAHLRRALEN
ncbi:RNA polymerase sigma factor [Nostoc ellipsosporum NOK]|uniref:RNA polymerase sigma factor n=1 Tax=Sphingomonas sp. IBVSS2 TaxID=1985172 RepID=UPI00211A5625|nr:RNA polymerase sigma factor [Sphingomonas sp. IBVSS2]MDF2386658.1 RNA polymerase sigma factor [Nostoc ellipsosporum NOK]